MVNPSAALLQMLSNLKNTGMPSNEYNIIEQAVFASPALISQLNEDIKLGSINGFAFASTGGVTYNQNSGIITFSDDFLTTQIIKQDVNPIYSLDEIIGHEDYHSNQSDYVSKNQKELNEAAGIQYYSSTSQNSLDATSYVMASINLHLLDEGGGNIQGWDDAVSAFMAAHNNQPLTTADIVYLVDNTSHAGSVFDANQTKLNQSPTPWPGITYDDSGLISLGNVDNINGAASVMSTLKTSNTEVTYNIYYATPALNFLCENTKGNAISINYDTLGLDKVLDANGNVTTISTAAVNQFLLKTARNYGGLVTNGNVFSITNLFDNTTIKIKDGPGGYPLLQPEYTTGDVTFFSNDSTPNYEEVTYIDNSGNITSTISGDGDNASIDNSSITLSSNTQVMEHGTGNKIYLVDNDNLLLSGHNNNIFISSDDYLVDNNEAGDDSLTVNGSRLGNSLFSVGNYSWKDSNGFAYTYVPNEADNASNLGTMYVSDGNNNKIILNNFDYATAINSAGGFDGLVLPDTVVLELAESDSSGQLRKGALTTFTVALGAPSNVVQTLQLTITGADASDFRINTGSNLLAFNSDGTVAVNVPAGQDSVTLALVNTGDAGDSADLQLTANLVPASSDASGGGIISSNTLDINCVAAAVDPFVDPMSANIILGSTIDDDHNLYQGDGSNDQITIAGLPILQNGNVVDGSSGDDSIVDQTGASNITTDSGNSVISLNNFQDEVVAGDGNDRIYGNSETTDLQTELNNAKNSSAATNAVGSFIAAGDGNNTIVGSDGNDVIEVGTGNNVIVAGPGKEIIGGGVEVSSVEANWTYSAVPQGGLDVLTTINNFDATAAPYDPPGFDPATYEGNTLGNQAVGSGNDVIFGGSGNSVFYLSNGDNYVDCGTGSDIVFGGEGDDSIFGGSGNVTVVAGGGDDYIDGETGNDYLVGDAGNNTIIGGSGNDTIFAGAAGTPGTSPSYFALQQYATYETGNNYVEGGSGNSIIYGSDGNDTLIGGTGNDTLNAGAGNEYVSGGDGNDLIIGGGGNDTLEAGGVGNDIIRAGSGNTTIYGGDGVDQITGGSGADVIYSGDGGSYPNYYYETQVSADQTDTSEQTTIYGGEGYNRLYGGAGNDVIYGGSGTTAVIAGSGKDTVHGGDSNATIYGGTGSDVLYAGDGGTDEAPADVVAGSSESTLYGGAGATILNDSESGNDLLVGGSGDATLVGIGNDTLSAGTADDVLFDNSGDGSVTYQFNSEFGEDSIVGISSGDTIEFGTNFSLDDFTITADQQSDGRFGFDIASDTGDIFVEGGLTQGAVGNIVFDDPQTLSLDQLITQGKTVSDTFATPTGNFIFSAADGDSVRGGDGNDTISSWGSNDLITAGEGFNTVNLNGAGDQVVGSDADLTVNAYAANETLVAGSGAETYTIADATDTVEAQAGSNVTINSDVSYTLPENVGALNLTGTADLVGTANTDDAVISGNAGNDTLTAGSGSGDTLVAGSGIDTLIGSTVSGSTTTYVVNNLADVITEGNSDSNDAIESSISYVLQAGINNLTLTGSNYGLTGTDSGTGDDVITGNGLYDSLVANSGHDTLVGSANGYDVFVVNSDYNTIVVNNSENYIEANPQYLNNVIDSSVSYVLPSGINALTLTGSGNISGTGSYSGDDTLTAGSGNDTLTGYSGYSYGPNGFGYLTGNNLLVAGSGNDILYASQGGNDSLVAGTGADTLVAYSSGDTFELNSGFGNVELEFKSSPFSFNNTPENDTNGTVEFGAGISASNLSLSAAIGSDGNAALLIQDGAGSVATIDDAFNGSIGQYVFSDGTSLSLQQLETSATITSSTVAGANGDFILNGDQSADIIGSNGSDTIYGFGDDDTIVAGDGNAQLFGFGADAVLVGGNGSDSLYGGTGNDQLVAGAGTSDLYGGSGTDTYVLTQGGNSTIHPNATSVYENIRLPDGMSPSDFKSYRDSNNNLVIQSLSGDTTSVIDGFYSPATANKTWILESDNALPELLTDVSLSTAPVNSSYNDEINNLRLSFAAELPGNVQKFVQKGFSLETGDYGEYSYDDPSDPHNSIFYNGTTIQTLNFGSGSLVLADSETDTSQETESDTTVTTTVPVYSNETTQSPGQFIGSASSAAAAALLNALENDPAVQVAVAHQAPGESGGFGQGYEPGPGVPGDGSVSGVSVTPSPTTHRVQTGTTTETTVVPDYHNDYSRSFIDYNLIGDGSNGSVSLDGFNNNYYHPQTFIGTVVAGNGNVNIDLGGNEEQPSYNDDFYEKNILPSPIPGAFIQLGDGNDTIDGSQGDDIIAAGSGFDYLNGADGADTYYVPLVEDSTDIISEAADYGGEPGDYLADTLVLPDGIKPEDLKYQFIENYYPPDVVPTGTELVLSYGSSSVVIQFSNNNEYYYPYGLSLTQQVLNSTSGIELFKFSDGTTLTTAQLLAQVTLAPSDFAPQVGVQDLNLVTGQVVAAATLFTATDNPDNQITYFKISNTGVNGGYFSLNGTQQATNQTFYVSALQLPTLEYVAGAAGQTDTIQVSAFDGGVWSNPNSFNVFTGEPGQTFAATDINQTVTGASSGASTIIGGYAADTLIGGTGGINTFVVSDPTDVVQDRPNNGVDTIQSSVNYVLPDNVENLILTNSGNITGTANDDNDVITGNSGQDALIGSTGNDSLTGGTGRDLIAGGQGNDSIHVTGPSSIIVFNSGDGQDTVQSADNSQNTLSLGGGIDYADLTFSKQGNDLVLGTGSSDSITLQNWYTSAAQQNFVNLQVIEQASATYDSSSSDAMYSGQVVNFDFIYLVTEFDQAIAGDPSVTTWNLSNDLESALEQSSNTQAYGGVVAYNLGMSGNLSGAASADVQSTLDAPNFGTGLQTYVASSGDDSQSYKSVLSKADSADAASVAPTTVSNDKVASMPGTISDKLATVETPDVAEAKPVPVAKLTSSTDGVSPSTTASTFSFAKLVNQIELANTPDEKDDVGQRVPASSAANDPLSVNTVSVTSMQAARIHLLSKESTGIDDLDLHGSEGALHGDFDVLFNPAAGNSPLRKNVHLR